MMSATNRIILHVGLPKTGTTSLQVGLKNAECIRYIHDPTPDLPQSRHFANAVGVGQDLLRKSNRTAWLNHFAESIQDVHIPLVVSDETLSQVSRIDWEALEGLLQRLEGEIHIVLVLRPFFSWLESLFNQFAKKGRVGILEFDPVADGQLNAYDINFEKIHSAYSALAERLGERCQLSVIRYSRDSNREICEKVSIPPSCLEAVMPLNPSPSPQDAMFSFLQLHNLKPENVELPPDGLRFLGYDEVDRLHDRHGPWMARLSEELGWPVEAIDDYEAFRATTHSTSLLQSLRIIYPHVALLSRKPHEKDFDMNEDTTLSTRKIKGDLARALLRMELKTVHEGQLAEETFKAAWTERRDEMLEKAALVRQTLSRMGYDLVKSATEEV
jgi:hypothetical protein